MSITANNITKHKGNTYNFNGSEFTSSGLVSPETIGSVTLTSAGADAGADAGSYPIVPSAATGGTFDPANYSVTYHNGTLNVDEPANITSSPSSTAADAGTTVVLSVTAAGTPTPTYQWKKGGNNLSNSAYDNGATVSGATTANLTLVSVRATDAGNYTCVVNNSAGSDTSSAATLTVNDPVITVQPANSTFECSSSNALTVTAIGTTNANGLLTYQWYTPDPSGTAITDATNSVLSFPTVSFLNAGSYSVVVSNALGNFITSSVVVVTIEDTNGPVISVIGGAATAECHGGYIDAGATALDSCDGPVSVTTNGVPDSNLLGTYIVTYTATDSHTNSSTATRVVIVQDTTVPTISLLGSAELTVPCSTPYTDAGATASDTCAGDLTSQIVTNFGGLNASSPAPGNYTITYNVQDPSTNAATQVTRLVHVVDTVPPVITVTPGVSTVECHTAYTDAGATANDNCAGVLSPTTTGTVNTNIVATYTLTYTASDGSTSRRPLAWCMSLTRWLHWSPQWSC